MRISNRDLNSIYEQAAAEYPAECCGIITLAGEGDDLVVHRCENIQSRLHAEDPEKFPRDARIAYYIDPQQLYDIVSAAEKVGGGVASIYHSHIDCEAYFSEEDKERAMAWDEPIYPDAVYLVVSVVDGQVRSHKGFAWDPGAADFAEVVLDVSE